MDSSRGSDIVAGPNEATFREKYDHMLTLPISEHEFAVLLRRLKLRYEVMARNSVELPPLRHSARIDVDKMLKCYQIYGMSTAHREEAYRAYVDSKHRVVYIENVFSYAIP